MSTTHQLDLVEAYLAEVRERLNDLPEEERGELLDDISAHVREVADEHGPENLRERLGSPRQFGDELRASAGYRELDTRTSRLDVAKRWRALLPDQVPERIGPLWEKLEPAWWLVRGAFVALLVLSLSDPDHELVPRIGSSRLLGFAALVASAAVSYRLGERRPATQSNRLRRARIAAEVGLALFGLIYVAQASGSEDRYIYSDGGYAQQDACLRDSAGRAIGNLFAFDPTGKPISQFFLTDQAGRGIDNLCPDQADPDKHPAETTYARDVNGAPVYNVFPRSQQRPTGVDERTGEPIGLAPIPAPAVLLPQVAPANSQPTETTTTVATPQP